MQDFTHMYVRRAGIFSFYGNKDIKEKMIYECKREYKNR